MAVIKDVAKLAGVSPSTVSKYLNNPQSVLAKNCEKIELAITELNYRPNLFARQLRVQDSHTIALIAQEIMNPFHATIYNTIRKAALKKNYSVILYSISDVGGELSTLLDSLPRNYFSGIIVCYFHDMDKSLEFALANKDIPFTIMSNIPYTNNLENVRLLYGDFAHGIEMITEFIIGQGRKKIAYVGCMTRQPAQEPKFTSFMRTMERHNLKPHSVVRLQKEYRAETGYESLKIILEKEERPDAILVDNDIMAIGVLRGLADHKIKVPEEIIVTGFDDITMASFYSPALTTVRVPIEAMSIKAFDLLYEMMEKGNIATEIPVFVPEIVVRETTS